MSESKKVSVSVSRSLRETTATELTAKSALELLRTVATLVKKPVLVVLNDVVRLDGPNGTWFFERHATSWRLVSPAGYTHRNTYVSLHDLALDFQLLYGIEHEWFFPNNFKRSNAVVHASTSFPSSSADRGVPDDAGLSAEELLRRNKASSVIARAFCRYAYRKCFAAMKVIRERAENLRSKERVVRGMQIRIVTRLVSCYASTTASTYGHFDLRYEDLDKIAKKVMAEADMNSGIYECAKGLKLCKFDYPLILQGLPSTTPTSFKTKTGKVIEVVHSPGELSKFHEGLLTHKFSPAWCAEMKYVVPQRDVMPLDFFDRESGKFMGGVIASRFVARYRCELISCLCIESFGASTHGKGYGNIMFDFCKILLFWRLDTFIESGVIFAQCVITPFWTHKLDETNVARALVFQLNHKFGDLHDIEDFCIKRCTFLNRAKDIGPMTICVDPTCQGQCKYIHVKKAMHVALAASEPGPSRDNKRKRVAKKDAVYMWFK